MTELVKRDKFIDSIKGLCVISVIINHTVFQFDAGSSTIIVKNLALFFDVPIFFFLTGCLLAIKPDLCPLKQMLKLIWFFFIFILFGELITGTFSLQHTLEPLMLNNAYLKQLVGLHWSYWFIPTYIASLLYVSMITKYLNKNVINIILILIPCYYVYSWFSNNLIEFSTFNTDFQMLFFYIWLMLLGQQTYQNNKKTPWIICGIFCLISLFLLIHSTPDFNLPNYKFPVKLPYCLATMLSVSLIMIIKKEIPSKAIQFIGNKALYFYLSQSIGYSLLFYIVPIIDCYWITKLVICFIINLILSLSIGFVFYYLDYSLKKFSPKVLK